jgi:succinate dehydrogenase/fumarate reductase cytochrome b subunit (b558 family)
VATSTLTPTRPSPTHSSIALKIVMAISGLYFVFFVLFHMWGNLKILPIFGGVHSYDEYAHHLRTMLEPILPYTGFLWLFRLSLIAAVALHIWSALTLWGRASGARRAKYSVKSTVQRTFSSQAMRWGGIALLMFILFHLAQFTVVQVRGQAGQPGQPPQADVIVVGTGLAGGAAAATLGEAGYNVLNFCYQDSPRRAHSIAAQGGINAAKNYRNDGDSTTGCSTTPSRAATTAPARPTSTASPRSAPTSSTSASRRASPSPASTAACSTTAPSAACRCSAPSTPAARRASSC